MFCKGDPNLLVCVKSGGMPPCLRSAGSLDSGTFTRACKAIHDGLLTLKAKKAGFTQEHFDSCMRVLNLLQIPNHKPILYHWPVEVIASTTFSFHYTIFKTPSTQSFFQDIELMDRTGAPYVANPFDHADDADFDELWKVAVGDFVLLRPPKNTKEPFWLGQVTSTKRFAGEQGVEFEYWELLKPGGNPYKDWWVRCKSKEIQHVPVYGDAVQDKIRMARDGNKKSANKVRLV